MLRSRSVFLDAVAARAMRGKRRTGSRPQAALAPGLAPSTTKRAAVVTAALLRHLERQRRAAR